jgi:DNA mismatch repair protein MutL
MPLEDFRQGKFEALMQMDATYILARLENRLFIFDQHAAAERVLYEKFMEAARNKTPHRQALLLPWVWEVSAQVAAVVQGCLEDFVQLGYALEPFGGSSFRVKAVPSALGDSPKVREILEGLAEDLTAEAIPRGWDVLLTRAACRGSVRAGDTLQASEMARVLSDLQKCAGPWSCPHGRPTFLQLSPEELAKRFKRL